MSGGNAKLTHVTGTFLIQADGAFLNGAGIDPRREDKNTAIPKSYRDGIGNRVPYVSAQAWRRWLRNTLVEETGWPASQLRAIDLSEKGTTNKIAGELNPVEFPEDDIFGYMRAAKGQGREEAAETDDEVKTEEDIAREQEVKFFKDITADIKALQSGKKGKGKNAKDLSEDERVTLAEKIAKKLKDEMDKRLSEDEEAIEDTIQKKLEAITNELGDKAKVTGNLKSLAQELSTVSQAFNPGRVKALMRSSPFASSILVSIRRKGWEGLDKGYVHLKEGTPLPYNTEFYNTHLQGVFCLNYGRLGVFWNLGDRIELDEEKAESFLRAGKLRIARDEGKLGKVYEMTDSGAKRKERATELLNALAVLRGAAKQAQFGTDVTPKVLILAGLTCGNPIFNHLFKDDTEGPLFKIETFKEIIADYANRIVTPVLIGMRKGYLKNESDVYDLNGRYRVNNNSNDRLTKVDGSSGDDSTETRFVEVKVMTPVEVAKSIGDLLP